MIRFPLLAICGSLLLAGCVTPYNTRLPTLRPRHPAVERRSYEYHDPFPNSDLGPETNQRPWGFARPRTQPRQMWQLRRLGPLPPEATPTAPQSEPLGTAYPESIHE